MVLCLALLLVLVLLCFCFVLVCFFWCLFLFRRTASLNLLEEHQAMWWVAISCGIFRPMFCCSFSHTTPAWCLAQNRLAVGRSVMMWVLEQNSCQTMKVPFTCQLGASIFITMIGWHVPLLKSPCPSFVYGPPTWTMAWFGGSRSVAAFSVRCFAAAFPTRRLPGASLKIGWQLGGRSW